MHALSSDSTVVMPLHQILAELERRDALAKRSHLRVVPPPPPPEDVDDADILEVIPHPAPTPAPVPEAPAKARKPRAPRKPKVESAPKAPRKPRARKAAPPVWQAEKTWKGPEGCMREFRKVEGSIARVSVPDTLKAWMASAEWKGSTLTYEETPGAPVTPRALRFEEVLAPLSNGQRVMHHLPVHGPLPAPEPVTYAVLTHPSGATVRLRADALEAA